MNREYIIITQTGSPEQTHEVGAKLATCLQACDIVLLTGDLGAGKTHFVQGVAKGLGASEQPTSPTFNIVLSYESGRLPLHHFDLYRLDEYRQLEDIALREYLESGGVCFVEWAEKFPKAFDEYLSVRISKCGETDREVQACAKGDRAQELLEQWQAVLAAGEGASASASPAVGCEEEPAPLPPSTGFEEEPVPASASVGRDEEPVSASPAVGREEEPAPLPPSAARFEENPAPASPAAGCEKSLAPETSVAQPAKKESPLDSGTADGLSAASSPIVLALDTANEVVALGLGALDAKEHGVRILATREIQAHRASNTQLIPQIDALLSDQGITRGQLACVCVGRGPGSFTGVRIAMATAKGISSALGVAMVGVSSLDAVAHNAWAEGLRGNLLVVADAMRKEVYPVRYELAPSGAKRCSADRVVKAQAFVDELNSSDGFITGDGLVKYRSLYEPFGTIAPEQLWSVSGRGLLMALQADWQAGMVDPTDAAAHDPAFALPVYTRLSDAEENERARLSLTEEKNLVTGVQDLGESSSEPSIAPDGGKGRVTMHELSRLARRSDDGAVVYRPLDAAHAADVAALETNSMGSDAWGDRLVVDELAHKNRSWWVAECDGALVGYAGGMVVDGDVQILKIAVADEYRRRGIARELLERVAADARNLGASTCSLEVRASNTGAQAFYERMGLENVGVRPRYYSDREDAVIMQGPLPVQGGDVAGMALQHHEKAVAAASSPEVERPLILAIESSCDETAAALADGSGRLITDVIASQIDFHSRFGGVVPEIASRKHIEAICGVCAEALGEFSWRDLDAIAVTYAPGLVGALVVGVAFAKGAAWALDVPFIGVNHLEGHLYANKIGSPDFEPPAVVSLVSGGNTMLVHMRGWGDYETLGTTIDDAVGEAFDKVAKALGLGYPGGPVISRAAAQGNPAAIAFPRAMMHSHDLRFSLSGLKTAVVNYVNKERQAGRELNIPDIAASFQQAVVDVQVAKAKDALVQTGARTFCLGGGVAANPALRAAYENLCGRMGVRLIMPPLASCGDNAGMIALVALDRYREGKFFDFDADAYAHADLDEPY